MDAHTYTRQKNCFTLKNENNNKLKIIHDNFAFGLW